MSAWGVCARGIDESSCQGSIDFVALKAGGFDFVITKGTQGATGLDPAYIPRVEAARRAGLLVPLMYHVLNSSPVNMQVQNACDHADALDVDIGLDFEVEGITAAQALAFTNGCWTRGKRVVLYSYPDFMRRVQDAASMAQLATQCEGYWSASYPGGPGGQKTFPPPDSVSPFVPAVFKGKWLFWQCSGDGGLPAPGVPSVVDHNLFNGDVAALTAWMQGTKSETFSNSA